MIAIRDHERPQPICSLPPGFLDDHGASVRPGELPQLDSQCLAVRLLWDDGADSRRDGAIERVFGVCIVAGDCGHGSSHGHVHLFLAKDLMNEPRQSVEFLIPRHYSPPLADGENENASPQEPSQGLALPASAGGPTRSPGRRRGYVWYRIADAGTVANARLRAFR